MRSPLSATVSPAELTLFMKLRLMNTPVRIQPATISSSVPTPPIFDESQRHMAMPYSPPSPEPNGFQRMPKR